MRRYSRWTFFFLGFALGIPLVSRAGGDVCLTRRNHYDVLELRMRSFTIDGVEQPVVRPSGGVHLHSDPGDHAVGFLVDPVLPPSDLRETRLRRL